MAPHSSTLAWKIPWTAEPGRLQSMGSLRVGHDWVTSLSLFTFSHWRRQWQPTPVFFLPGESQGWGKLGRLPSTGSHRVGHDWCDLAAAAAAAEVNGVPPSLPWHFPPLVELQVTHLWGNTPGNSHGTRMTQHEMCWGMFTMKLMALQGQVTWVNIPQAFLLMLPLNFLLKCETYTTVCLRKGSFKASRASTFVIIQACYPQGELKEKTEKSVSFPIKSSLPSQSQSFSG